MAASPFPEFITSRRRELDLTLGDVANSLGVSPITVSNWSSGASTPEPEHLTALADLLDVPADELAEMAGVTLRSAGDAAVNLMPPTEAVGVGDESIAMVAPPVAEPREPEEPEEPVPADDPDDVAVVAVPDADLDLPAEDEVAAPDEIDSDLAELLVDAAETEEAPDSVPAFVAPPAPAPPTTAPPERKRVSRRSRPAPAAEREVLTLPLTYIEDPRQLMRYRIRWMLTVVILLIMFIILLWASREFISALAEVKESVTPGGIGGG